MVSPGSGVRSLLFLPALLVWVGADECPRDRSRLARNILNQVVLSIYRKFDAVVPYSCPWAPERDIYRTQEEHKTWTSDYQWDCLFCGKAFYSEDFLDRHMRRKHHEAEYQGKDKVCLASLCPLLRCEALQSGISISYWQRALCKDRDMAPLRDKCEATVHRCLPLGHRNSDEIRSLLLANLCSYLTCTMRWKEPPNWGRLWNVTYLIVGLMVGLGVLVVLMVYCLNQSSKPESNSQAGGPQRAWYSEPGHDRAIRRRKFPHSPRHRQVY